MKHCWQHIICLTAILTVAVMHSCTEVELCENPDHPHHAKLAFKFNWDGVTPDGRNPRDVDSMMVIANRIINSWRAGFLVELPKEKEGTVAEGETIFGVLESYESVVGPETGETENGEQTEGEGTGKNEGQGTSAPQGSYLPVWNTKNVLTRAEGETTGGNNTTIVIPETAGKQRPTGPLEVKEGEYQFIAINYSHSECEIDRVEQYQKDVSVASTELFIRYVTFKKDNPKLQSLGRPWIDYNSGIGQFVESEIRPTYLGINQVCHVRAGETEIIEIKPEQITQRYGLHFSIEKEPGVRIEEIIAIIGGIPQRFGVSTKHVDVKDVNKMAFRVPVDATKMPTYDSRNPASLDNETSIPFKASFNAIGLVRSYSPELQMGAGILQLCIYTSTERPDAPGQRASKTIYALINLYNTITEARPMRITEDKKFMVQNSDTVTLNIPNVLRIKQGQILANPDGEGALDKWKEVGNSDNEFNVDI